MTIPNDTNRVELAGDGTVGPFNIPFHFFADNHIRVWVRDNTAPVPTNPVEQVLNTDYQVFNANTPPTGETGTPSGYINFLVTPPTVDQTVVIWREPPNQQLLSLPNFGGVPLRNYEGNYDIIVEMLHTYLRQLDRCVQLAEGARAQNLKIPAGSADLWLALDENGDLVVRTIATWIYVGSPPPDDSLGNNGDIGIDDTGRLWFKVSDVWVDSGIILQGVPGPNLGMRYDWEIDTDTLVDPGSGRVKRNADDTEIAISKTDKFGVDKTAEILAWVASTTAGNKGHVRLVTSEQNSKERHYFLPGALVDAGTFYRVTTQLSSASATLPASGIEMGILWARTGDKGSDGAMAGPGAGTIAQEAAVFLDGTGNTVARPGTSHTLGAAGTSAQRPGAPPTPARRFNTSTSREEYWDGSAWREVADVNDVAAVNPLGRHTIAVPLYAMTARKTNGAAVLAEETATNKNMITGFRFAAGVNQFVQHHHIMPRSWDLGGLNVLFMFRCETATTGNVRLGIRAVAYKAGSASDLAFATGTITQVAVPGIAKQMKFSAELAFTVANTPAYPCSVMFEVYREGSNAGDTAAGNLDLLDLAIFYKTDTPTDDAP